MFKVYQDSRGEWRWKLLADNYKVIADSAEGYKEQRKCLAAIDKVIVAANGATIRFASEMRTRDRRKKRKR